MKKIIDLNKKARAILINGRPFVEYLSLGQWMGFRWGKAEISIRTWSPVFATDLWRSIFYIKGDAWNLDAVWDLEILRNLNAGLDEKLKTQKKRLMEEEKRLRFVGEMRVTRSLATQFFRSLAMTSATQERKAI